MKHDNKTRAVIFAATCSVQYALLIALKGLGISKLDWLTVLLGVLWIPLLLLIIGAVCAAVVIFAAWVKHEIRVRKVTRRIIRKAKAAGVWGKPQCLRGKALELKAKEFNLTRMLGETDVGLRRRIRAAMPAKELKAHRAKRRQK